MSHGFRPGGSLPADWITHGPILGVTWTLFAPLALTMMASATVGVTDMYVAGFLGSAAQAAVGFADQILFLVLVIGSGLAAASASFILLIEMLVALVMAAFVSLALYESYAASLRASTNAENQVTAAVIAQECLDEARNETWPALVGFVASYPTGSPQQMTLSGSQASLGTAGRPLSINTDLNYDARSLQRQFSGTCTRAFDYAPGTNSIINVTVTVTWSQGSTSPRTIVARTSISSSGIHD